MTPKGPSSVDPDHRAATPADADLDAPTTRRRALLAALAGLGSAALVSHRASAAPDERPNRPTDADRELLTAAVGVELAARDLYRSAASNAGDELVVAVEVMAESHEAFAQAISGDAGLSTQSVGRTDAVFDQFEEGFAGNIDQFGEAAHRLEQTAVATHTALIEQYESADAIGLTASILLAEARHATILADVLGIDEPSIVFATTESALSLGGGA